MLSCCAGCTAQQELVACFQREWTLIKRTAFIYVRPSA